MQVSISIPLGAMYVSRTVSEIICVKEWRDLETGGSSFKII